MKVYNHILQGSDATEENALNHAQGFDFDQDGYEEYNKTFLHDSFIDTVHNIDIYYNRTADYYFFADNEEQPAMETAQSIEYPLMYKGYIIKVRNDHHTNNEPKLYAYSYSTDVFLNPIYKKWDSLKKVIDNLKII